MARKRLIAMGAAAAALATMIAPGATAGIPEETAAPDAMSMATAAQTLESYDRFVVKYKDMKTMQNTQSANAAKASVSTVAKARGASIAEQHVSGMGSHIVTLNKELSKDEANTFMAQLKAQPGVSDVYIDQKVYPMAPPNDPYWGQMWDLKNGRGGLNTEPLRGVVTGAGVTVAVIDTGITDHPDLRANILPGYDMISYSSVARDGNGRDNDPTDEGDWMEATDSCNPYQRFISSSWHGTHVAGEIAAIENNNQGVLGVASRAKVVPVRVLGHCGGYTSDIVDGMLWAAGIHVNGVPDNPNPAKVLNMSLGGSGQCDADTQAAIRRINNLGATIVVAAGNENRNVSNSNPANCDGVISIAANGPDGSRAYYSNYGAGIDVMAAGGDQSSSTQDGIVSTVNTGTRQRVAAGYGWMQGTSMATPHVAGVVAMMYQINPNLTYNEVLNILRRTVKANTTCNLGCGAGIVDANAAVTETRNRLPQPQPTPTATATVRPTATATTRPPTTQPPSTQPPAAGEKIVNGNFESTVNTAWSGDSWVITDAGSFAAHSGKRYAWFGGFGNSNTSYIKQTVTVPTNGKLSFWLAIGTEETTTSSAYDTFKVQIYNSNGTLLKTLATFSNLNSKNAWSQYSYSLSAYAGQNVTIKFTGTEDASKFTSFLLDDVSVR